MISVLTNCGVFGICFPNCNANWELLLGLILDDGMRMGEFLVFLFFFFYSENSAKSDCIIDKL